MQSGTAVVNNVRAEEVRLPSSLHNNKDSDTLAT